MRIISALVLFACLRLMAADMTVKQYQKDVSSSDQQRSDAAKLLVMGIGNGVAWANAAAEKKGSPLYCQPAHFAMNGNNYVEILEKMIKNFESKTTTKELNAFPAGLLLVMGLQESFPCQGAK